MRKRLVAVAGIGMTAAASLALTLPAHAAPTAAGPSISYQTISASPDGKGNGNGNGNNGANCNPTPVYPMSQAAITIGPNMVTAVNGRYSLTGTYTCNGKSLRGHHLIVTLTQVGTPPQVIHGRTCGFTKYSGGAFKCNFAATGSGIIRVSSKAGVMSNPVIGMQ